MIHPDHWHKDYMPNIDVLIAQDFRFPHPSEKILGMGEIIIGATTYLVNDQSGQWKSVDAATGEIADVPPRAVPGPAPAP